VDFQRENKNAFGDLTVMVKARINQEKKDLDTQTAEEKKKKKDKSNEDKVNRSFQVSNIYNVTKPIHFLPVT